MTTAEGLRPMWNARENPFTACLGMWKWTWSVTAILVACEGSSFLWLRSIRSEEYPTLLRMEVSECYQSLTAH